MKRVLALLLILAMGLAMTACARSDVVAVVDDTNIRLAEAKEIYKFVYEQTAYLYAMYYGMVFTPGTAEEKDFAATMKANTLNMMAENVVLEKKLNELGLALTEEELAEIEASAVEEYDGMVASLLDVAEDADEETRAAAEATAKESVDQLGYTMTAVRYLTRADKITEKLRSKVVEFVVPTQADIEVKFAESLAAQEETYASTPNQFAIDVMYGNTIYTRPEGYRYIKNIVIGLSDEMTEQLNAKSSELSTARSAVTTVETQLAAEDAPTGDEKAALETQLTENQALVTSLEAEVESLRQKAMDEIRPKAEEVLALAKEEGADFDALLAEYSIDTPTEQEIIDNGYPVYAGSTAYVQSFTDGAMALANVGDVSDLVESQYGFHILMYTGDVPAGPVPLEDVRAEVEEQVLTALQDETFDAQVSYWISQYKNKIKTYTIRLKVD